MKQKTYLFQSDEAFLQLVRGIREDGDYRSARCRLLNLVETCTDAGRIQTHLDVLRRELPDALVAGMTGGGFLTPEDRGRPADAAAGSISLCLFAESEAHVIAYDVRAMGEADAGRDLCDRIKALPHVQGVQVFTAGVHADVGAFLSRATDSFSTIPLFGAVAGVPVYDQSMGEVYPLVFATQIYAAGIVAVVFCGERLRIRATPNFGWQPLGKELEVTATDGPLCMVTIDGMPATYIYEIYLHVKPDQYFMGNVCEFPLLLTERYGIMQARVPIRYDDEGKLYFGADVRAGEKIRLCYGNVRHILAETQQDAQQMHRFGSQALFLYICANRSVYLKGAAMREMGFYRAVNPNMFWCFGWGEVMKSQTGGGLLNTSVVAVGMHEGDVAPPEGDLDLGGKAEDVGGGPPQTAIPLPARLVAFLEATNRELKESSEAKSNFLSNMSHEIRTPINAVLGLDEMILRECTDGTIRGYALDIQRAGKTLLSLINDILDFSKIEANKLEIIPEDYDISNTVSDLVNMTLPGAQSKGLDLTVDVDASMPHRLFGDEPRLKQCMLNVLTNAVKYTHKGGITFSLRAEKKDDEHILLTVRVVDTGIGIKKEDIQRLFSPFERIEESRNRNIEGSGLGMSIVKGLLAKMGSHLVVKSEYGYGSDFSFTVEQQVRDWEPVGDYVQTHARVTGRVEQYQESFQAPDARILVVDDMNTNLTVICGLLKSTRIMIDTAESAAQALELARQKPYHLLLVDHLMPRMDGIQMLEALRKDDGSPNQHTACIALTANAITGAREMYIMAGFAGYLSKPVDGKLLEAMLRRHLPPELILLPGQAGFVQAEEASGGGADALSATAGVEARELFAEVFGLDIEAALRNCGDREVLVGAARSFRQAIAGRAAAIEEYAAAGSLHDYTVQVHGLKGSAKLIGAMQLAQQAAYLEQCGNGGNLAEIAAKTPQLLRDYRAYEARLAPLCGEAPAAAQPAPDSRPVIPQARLDEALAALREYVSVFDFNGADAVAQALADYRMPDSFAPAYAQIVEKLQAGDREALLPLLRPGAADGSPAAGA